jgi:IS4 transposase
VPLRRIKFYDVKHDTLLVRLTNHFDRPALTITELHRCRWQVALFVTWIKQHLRIKAFLGTSENAVTTQVWIAIAVYVLVAVVKKRLNLNIDASLYMNDSIDSEFDALRENASRLTACPH